ncbi:MAG: hypothetical protein EBQ94_11840 [Flavobacteriales bacterium]|nr:hypothetical protein [Crocinitomicaceae bacterium]NBX81046.1 hypothetical protein [Flavobacteriales bacterium]NCA21122.1 hypothetical protein [Crocinitomicaceae bacterium]
MVLWVSLLQIKFITQFNLKAVKMKDWDELAPETKTRIKVMWASMATTIILFLLIELLNWAFFT